MTDFNLAQDKLPYVEFYPGTNKIKSMWVGTTRMHSHSVETAPTYIINDRPAAQFDHIADKMRLCPHGLEISEVAGAEFEECEINTRFLLDWHVECFVYPNGANAEVSYAVHKVGDVYFPVQIAIGDADVIAMEKYLAKKHNIEL